MEEGTAMSEKILRAIENIFKDDPDLQEFIIVPTEDNTKNKSPILYEQHNIGLESWCIKHVYQYACSILFSHRELLLNQKKMYSTAEDLNYLLIGTILINPDVGTFWNMKRDLVEMNVLNMESELRFSKIVLSHKSKSNEAFSYRRWLVKRILNKTLVNDLQAPLGLLQNEFMVVDMASEKSANNYHSWNHRIWCMENIASSNPRISDIVYAELSYSQEWINNHVSEHAGYHYRQYLLKLVMGHKNMVSLFEPFYNYVIKYLSLINDGDCSNLLVYLLGKQNKVMLLEETYSYINYISMLLYDLFVLIDKLNKLFPEHESLFYHRRFLVFHLIKLIYDYHNVEFPVRNRIIDNSINVINNKNIVTSDVVVTVKSTNGNNECNQWPKLFKLPVNKIETCNLYKIILNSEKRFVSENSNNNCRALQAELARKYQKWMRLVIGIE